VPQGTTGLLAAGRFLSATHEAHASARSIGQCTATGQAAGTAAALAAADGVDAADVDVARLRRRLLAAGAVL
jgi:hypothetical protein